MYGTRCYPESLVGGLRLIKAVYHFSRYKRVSTTMNEEHRIRRSAYSINGRGLAEAPAIAYLTQQTGGIHQWERGQSELVLQLTLKHVPRARIATVIDKAQVLDTLGHLFSRQHHRGSTAHRHPMHHHRVRLEDGEPVAHILAVQQPHLNHIALTQTMSMQIGQHHIISAQHPLIETSQEEKGDGTVAPAVDDQCRLRATRMDIEGMMALTCRHDDERVTQCPYPIQTVYP